MPLSRRNFLQASAAATVGAAGSLYASEVFAAEPKRETPMPLVDTHQHLWDLSKFKLPWIKPGEALGKSFVTKDYLAAAEGLNVAAAVYMEVDVTPEQQVAEAEHITELCKDPRNLTVAAVISGRPASDKFRAYVSPYKESKVVKGVRQVLHAPDRAPGYCLEKNFVQGIQLLGELGLSFDLCMRAQDLGNGVKLVEQCPHTRFIVDHCGNGSVAAFNAASKEDDSKKKTEQYRHDMANFAKHERVMCKISGIVGQMKPGAWSAADLAPIINFCLDTFGPDRVMFGSDWPVCTTAGSFRDWVTALREIVSGRSLEQQHKLFHANAVKFYGLKSVS